MCMDAVCIHICALHVCLVSADIRKKDIRCLKLGVIGDYSHQVGARNRTQLSAKIASVLSH